MSPLRPLVMSSTIWPVVTDEAGTCAAIWPRYRAATLSATCLTSFMLCEMRMTASPLSARRRTRFSTCSVCATPRAAVGSSRMTSLLFQSTDLAMATVCRWPPDSEETFVPNGLERAHRQALQRLDGALLHADLVEEDPAAVLPAEEDVLDDVEVVAEREVLVDDLDPERVGVLGRVHRDGLAVEGVRAVVEGVDAGDPLDQGGLAGAVVTDQGGHLAGPGVEIDALEDVHRAEALLDAAQAEQRRGRAAAGGRGLGGLGHAPSLLGARRRCRPGTGRTGHPSRPAPWSDALWPGAGPLRARAPGREESDQLMPLAAQAFCRAGVVQTFSLVVKPSAMTSFTLSL